MPSAAEIQVFGWLHGAGGVSREKPCIYSQLIELKAQALALCSHYSLHRYHHQMTTIRVPTNALNKIVIPHSAFLFLWSELFCRVLVPPYVSSSLALCTLMNCDCFGFGFGLLCLTGSVTTEFVRRVSLG